jgi:exopolyphosphatase / guanosine-5'-triphosphate,3'-diphosphate pyrophosphatase
MLNKPPFPPAPAAQPVLAGIDMGSNSFRLEIGQMIGGRYKRVHYTKETVRLGAGLDANGQLTPEAVQRGLACLRRFASQLTQSGVQHVRAVATQTLREAQNRDAFLLQAQAALGHPVEVISGREEARLIYVGVAHLQPSKTSATTRLVIDIGGRSTELILARGDKPVAVESFAVGSVSLSMRYFPDGKLTSQAFRSAQIAAGAEFEEGLTVFGREHWREALGSSGTAGAVSEVLQANGITDGAITPAGLQTLIERCIAVGHVDKIVMAGLKEDRRAVIPGGLALLYTLAAQFGIDALQPAKGALRQGVIVELHERLQAQRQGAQASERDARSATVRALQKSFAADAAQARRVHSVALALWQGVWTATGDEHALELGWAADLHELGMLVSHHDFHRHSAYVLGHADAPGFSQNQLRRLADMVMGQRGGLRKIDAALANRDDPAFAWQVLALRLAVIKCHARGAVNHRALRLRKTAKGAEVQVTTAWQQNHARTNYLLQEESELWTRQGPFGLRVVTEDEASWL